MQLHIVYTESDMLLTKRVFVSWREIQEAYHDYKASLGPWNHEEVAAFLSDEYSKLLPPAEDQVTAFLASSEETMSVTFVGRSNVV